MKLKQLLVPLLAVFASLSTVQAAVTIAFNGPFSGGMSSNLANRNGVVSNGLKWGILVDTANNGMISGPFDPFALVPGTSVNLSIGGFATDNRLILATDLTSDSSQGGQLLESDFVTPGGNGGVTGLSFALSGGVTAGNSFFLIWIDESGPDVRAGFLSSSQFLMPADGQTVTYSNVFVGVDPVRSASNTFFIPEPSAAVLGLLGAVSLLRRRR